jgi:predicted lipid-binding transport protein (Tim44 family)
LAVIAGIILYRLYSVLGEQTGFDKEDRPDHEGENIFSLDHQREKKQTNRRKEAQLEKIESHLRAGVQAMTKLDPNFSLKDFKQGLEDAFEMILMAFAQGDLATLDKMLSPDIFHVFEQAIHHRQSNGYTMENTLIRIESVDILEASVDGQMGLIKAKIVSEQVPLMRDNKGKLVEGNPQQIDQIIDYWIFERLLTSPNPNWTLTATEL